MLTSIVLLLTSIWYTTGSLLASNAMVHSNEHYKYFESLLEDINKEQTFETLLMLKSASIPNYELHQAIYRYPVPKMLLTKAQADFYYRSQFNSEILTIIIMASYLDNEIMQTLGTILENMRQSRIFTIALCMKTKENEFKHHFLLGCKSLNLTNNLLQFVYSDGCGLSKLWILKPYPIYHWDSNLYDTSHNKVLYYRQHWRNMQNKTLLTYVDNSTTKSLYYRDDWGNLKLNGYVVRLIMLFAELYNATLKMAFPLSDHNSMHYTLILKEMVRKNLLDIPMVTDTSTSERMWWNFSDTYEYDQGLFMVPCAQPLSIGEVYGILLNGYFLGCIAGGTMLLSFMHFMIDYILEDWLQWSHLLLSDRIFRGLIGQTFMARQSTSSSLKIVYLILFVLGLYLSTLFSVSVSSLFTRPSYHPQIETANDLMKSPLKILLYEEDAFNMGIHIKPYQDSVILTRNFPHLQELRHNLNTTYSYYSSLAFWKMTMRKQTIFARQIFCTSENLTIFPYLPWAIPLQKNSPYKEALNNLIHWVHAFGLMEAWISSTFEDILKLQPTTSRHGNDKSPEPKPLTLSDMYWIWIMLMGGHMLAGIVFFLELFWSFRKNYIK
uniref:Ionotropic glutamate receptor C-terminal domain-containing protein n=1 Tax=Stomoxys calcitrans TaxID=35570 RepID=A0A2Y9D4N5_STOCA